MKAIRTHYLPHSSRRPARIVASTGEHKQQFTVSIWSDQIPDGMSPHAFAARELCRRMGWNGEMIGGAFPNGDHVWTFNDPSNKDRFNV